MWPYHNEVWKEEELYRRVINYDDVLFRMGEIHGPKKDKLEKDHLEKERETKEVAAKTTTEKEILEKKFEAL
jgi:hypothetical protein